MAITPITAGTVAAPNSKTSVTAGAVAVPISKTSVTAGAVAIPVSKTSVTAGAVAVPVSKTSVTAGTVAIPVTKTSVAASAVAIPVTKTSVTAGAVAVPVTKTSVAAAALPRTLTPLVDLDFAQNLYYQSGINATFDDLFTYTRASSGSFVNRRMSGGQWKYFLDNDYVGSVTNKFLYSQAFENAAWTKSELLSVTDNSALVPAGTITAAKLVESTATDSHYISQTLSITSGTTYTVSFLAKSTDRNIALEFTAAGFTTQSRIKFNLKSGLSLVSTGSVISAKIVDEGNGWFRCSATKAATATGSIEAAIFYLLDETVISYAGNGSSYVYLGEAQLTASNKNLPYVESIGTAVTDTFTENLRIEYDRVTGKNIGALIESAATNSITQSEDLSHADWTKAETTVTNNASIAFDETTSACKIIDSVVSGPHVIRQTGSVTAGNLYTLSVYAKLAERNLNIEFSAAVYGDLTRVYFDLAAGTYAINTGTVSAAKMEYKGSGWYRCSVTKLCTVTTTGNIWTLGILDGTTRSYAGDASSGLLLWGAQFQLGGLTSYIPTTTVAVSNLADDLSISTDNTPIGTKLSYRVECDLNFIDYVNNQVMIKVASDVGDSYLRVEDTTGVLQVRHGATNANTTFTMAQDTLYDVVMTFDGATRNTYVDGVNYNTVSGSSTWVVNDDGNVFIGQNGSNLNQLNGHIKKLSLYNSAMTAQEVTLL